MDGEFADIDVPAALELEGEPRKMSELVRAFKWGATPLGDPAFWPPGLKTTVRILLTSRFPMWMAWGPELTVLYNDAYARTTLGKKHPWALGKPADVVWSEIWKDIGPRIERVLETGEASWDETLFLILERGGYREETYHTFSYSPLVGPEGGNAGMLCVVMEDTARVLGERQLGSLGKLARALVDANSRNEVFAAIERGLEGEKDIPFALLYLFDEVESGRLKLVAHCGIEKGHAAACEKLVIGAADCPWPVEFLSSNQPVTVEYLSDLFPSLPTGTWDRPPERARMVPFARKGQDTPVGIFIAGVNPYRQLDASYAGYLDLIAGQLAASITNAEAFEEEKTRAEALAELDRAKTSFFSNISHELRTPLTLILGPVEDALTSQTPPTRAGLEMLHRNALRLLKMVNGLLDFVRIEAGRLRASYEATDLSLLTTQLASVFRSAMERAGLQYMVECPPLPEPVYVDREMWEKIVLNLVSNALKSTFDGEIRVAISTDGASARLTVTDTGTGIPDSEQPHLFERFRRVEGARRRSHEGTGIGLALVKELVELHGGSIDVESSLGTGTAFTVTIPFGQSHLPRERVVDDSANPVVVQGSAVAYVREAIGWLPGRDRLADEVTRAEPGDRPQRPEPEGGEVRRPVILLADDNADMREYVRGLLGGRFDILVAANGKEALEFAARAHPDLIVSDVMMPEMDGFALLKAIRENTAIHTTPMIMLSARAGEESRIEGLTAGADDYLTKPFTARELLARVEAQLKIARLKKEAAEQQSALSREVQQARQFAWEALEHIPDCFATLDRDYRLTYMNAAAKGVAAVMGIPHLGRSLFDIYPALLGTPVEEHFRRGMEQRVPVEFEQYFRSDHAEAWYQFQLYPQPDEGLIVYMRETTESRRTEQALRRSEQLAAAGRLAASIAHEINNPLEAVTNLMYLVKMDEALSSESRGLLDVADRELQRLSHITSRSLKFYRQRTAPSMTAIDDLIDSVLFFHETEIKMRNIELRRRYRPAPAVLCLTGEIQQVFTNLISNALEAIDEKGKLSVGVCLARDCPGASGRGQHHRRYGDRNGSLHDRAPVPSVCHHQRRVGNRSRLVGVEGNPRQASRDHSCPQPEGQRDGVPDFSSAGYNDFRRGARNCIQPLVNGDWKHDGPDRQWRPGAAESGWGRHNLSRQATARLHVP
jgi:signal transduction histidine kinase/CheY-like chemotaxis protein